MDISSDLAAIQSRIAEITGADAAPAVAPPALAPPAAATLGNATGFAAYLQQMMEQAPAPSTAPMVMPVNGAISSPFGQREDPMGEGGTEFHPGIDIAAEQGAPIQAAIAGTVVAAGPDGGYGNLITVDDGNGLTTRYGHCSRIFAQVGERVAPGDVIGAVGMTGRATGPHLHFEVRRNDQPVDPTPYLNLATTQAPASSESF